MDNYTPTVSDLTGLFIHSAVKRTGNVSFSHPVRYAPVRSYSSAKFVSDSCLMQFTYVSELHH
jgi:hypothetical protein